jgi:hypothetical protein
VQLGSPKALGHHEAHHVFSITSPETAKEWSFDLTGAHSNIHQAVYEADFYNSRWVYHIRNVHPFGTAKEVMYKQGVGKHLDAAGRAMMFRQGQGVANAVEEGLRTWKAELGLDGKDFVFQSVKRYAGLEALVPAAIQRSVEGYDGAVERAKWRKEYAASGSAPINAEFVYQPVAGPIPVTLGYDRETSPPVAQLRANYLEVPILRFNSGE